MVVSAFATRWRLDEDSPALWCRLEVLDVLSFVDGLEGLNASIGLIDIDRAGALHCGLLKLIISAISDLKWRQSPSKVYLLLPRALLLKIRIPICAQPSQKGNEERQRLLQLACV